jgi:3-oxoacyl-[acyl-carrier protein] reductase
LVVNDLDEAPAYETVEQIRSSGGEAVAVPGSVTNKGFSDDLIAQTMQSFDDLHIVVNNAGYTWDSVIQKTTDEQWSAMLDIHLTAPFRVLRSVAPYFRESARRESASGRSVTRKVVNISSIAGTGGNAGQAGYSSGKAGVIGLTKTMAKEWGRYQVTVNGVAFGLIRTRLTEASAGADATIRINDRDIKVGIGDELIRSMEQGIPLGRAGTPADAADAVYLFCAPESDYITGQVIVCGGGLVL